MKDSFKILFMAIIIQSFSTCSIFENEDYFDNSEIDYLTGTEESGRLKKELHFSDSADETIESDIEFVYKRQINSKNIYRF